MRCDRKIFRLALYTEGIPILLCYGTFGLWFYRQWLPEANGEVGPYLPDRLALLSLYGGGICWLAQRIWTIVHAANGQTQRRRIAIASHKDWAWWWCYPLLGAIITCCYLALNSPPVYKMLVKVLPVTENFHWLTFPPAVLVGTLFYLGLRVPWVPPSATVARQIYQARWRSCHSPNHRSWLSGSLLCLLILLTASFYFFQKDYPVWITWGIFVWLGVAHLLLHECVRTTTGASRAYWQGWVYPLSILSYLFPFFLAFKLSFSEREYQEMLFAITRIILLSLPMTPLWLDGISSTGKIKYRQTNLVS